MKYTQNKTNKCFWVRGIINFQQQTRHNSKSRVLLARKSCSLGGKFQAGAIIFQQIHPPSSPHRDKFLAPSPHRDVYFLENRPPVVKFFFRKKFSQGEGGFKIIPDKSFNLKITTKRSNQGHSMMLHTHTPNQCPYQVSTSYTSGLPSYSPEKLFPPPVYPLGHHG